MFSTFKGRLLLGVYIFILLSIPVGAFLATQNQTTKSKASEPVTKPIVKVSPQPTLSPAKQLLSVSTSDTSPTVATNFGPTLSLKAALEGRATDNQSTSLFVGIIDGDLTSNPKFLLSFTIDLPKSGQYSNLSLAGLTSGSKYTALLKGSAQIATSSGFIMSPSVTNLNDGQALNMLSGDLNQDNVINSADYSIAIAAIGSTASSSNWNGSADLNKDGVVNVFDLAIINRNINKTGASGAWTSPIPKVATPSASVSSSPPIGGPANEAGGYWICVPHLSN